MAESGEDGEKALPGRCCRPLKRHANLIQATGRNHSGESKDPEGCEKENWRTRFYLSEAEPLLRSMEVDTKHEGSFLKLRGEEVRGVIFVYELDVFWQTSREKRTVAWYEN